MNSLGWVPAPVQSELSPRLLVKNLRKALVQKNSTIIIATLNTIKGQPAVRNTAVALKNLNPDPTHETTVKDEATEKNQTPK